MVKLHVRVSSEVDDLHFQLGKDLDEVRHLLRQGSELKKHKGYELYPLAMVDHSMRLVWSFQLEGGNISYASLKIPLSFIKHLAQDALWAEVRQAQDKMHMALNKVATAVINQKVGGTS